MGENNITLDKPEAQAFSCELIELCNRHRVRLSGAMDYPLIMVRLPDGMTITGYDTKSTAFFNPDPPLNFDLVVESTADGR